MAIERSQYIYMRNWTFECRRISILVENFARRPCLLPIWWIVVTGLVRALSVMHAPRKCHCRKTLEFARIDAQTFAPPENQDSRDIQPRERGGGRFMLKSSVTSCRSSADEMVTFSHFPSGYVRASS
jgi:hypothetical protein